jgi:hypothetical protein
VEYNGCNSIDYVDITALNFEAYAGTDKTICSDSLKLNARDDGGFPQSWTVISGQGEFVDSNLHDTWVKTIGLGENIFRWSVTINGATDTDDVLVTRVTSSAGQDQILCENHTFLNGNIPQFNSFGNWLVVAGSGTFADPTLYNTEVTGLANQNNTFAWIVDAGICQATDYVLIEYNYVFAEAGPDRILCQSSLYMDAAQPQVGSQGLWTIISGVGEIINPTLYNTQVVNMNIGDHIFQWTVFSDHCQDEDVVQIYNDEVIANAGVDQYIQKNNTYLNAYMPDNATGLWTLEFGSGIISNENDPNTFVSGLSQGANTFKWTLTNDNCSDYDVVHVIYNYTEIEDLSTNLKIYPNPFDDFLVFENENELIYPFEIKDIFGKTILSGILLPHTWNNQNLSSLESGIYFIYFKHDSNNFVVKVIKK